jgi:hypothetical protein
MKRPLATALATALLAATLTAPTAPALAKDKHWKPHPPPHHHPQPGYYAAPFFFGTLFGLALTQPYYAPYPPPPPPPPYPYYAYGYYSPHVQWCMAHYKTYNPATNTYFIKPRVPAVCVSPYPYW